MVKYTTIINDLRKEVGECVWACLNADITDDALSLQIAELKEQVDKNTPKDVSFDSAEAKRQVVFSLQVDHEIKTGGHGLMGST